MPLEKYVLQSTVTSLDRRCTGPGIHSIAALLRGAISWMPFWAHSNPTYQNSAGYAYDREGATLLYKEIHNDEVDANGEVQLRTLYSGPGGETPAARGVSFSDDASAPQFRLQDSRARFSEGLYRKSSKTYVDRELTGRQDQAIRNVLTQDDFSLRPPRNPPQHVGYHFQVLLSARMLKEKKHD